MNFSQYFDFWTIGNCRGDFSKNPDVSISHVVMSSFWTVTRTVLRINDDAEWKVVRSELVDELAKFRMKAGGFACENYNMTNSMNT